VVAVHHGMGGQWFFEFSSVPMLIGPNQVHRRLIGIRCQYGVATVASCASQQWADCALPLDVGHGCRAALPFEILMTVSRSVSCFLTGFLMFCGATMQVTANWIGTAVATAGVPYCRC
jgi:hypothetical protein